MKNMFFSHVFFFVLLFISWLWTYSQSPIQSAAWKAPAYTDTLKNPLRRMDAVLKDGQKIYENICWTCHGLKGRGDGPASSTLNPKPSDHTSPKIQQETDGALFWKISNGKGAMQPYGKVYSSKQRWALVNYIRVLGKNNESNRISSGSK
jgi:mono/diheme cytochrome c family protein